MAKTRKREPRTFPHWLVDALKCPACGAPCWATPSGGMSCRRVPAHTGLIPHGEVNDKVVAAWSLAHARELTEKVTNREKAVVLAHQYLRASAKTLRAEDEVKG